MPATFGGTNIFGFNVKQNGPIPTRRAMREQLPGVRGYRSYSLTGNGADTKIFTMTGRLTGITQGSLIQTINQNIARLNTFATLVDNGGISYGNCQLLDYRQYGPYMPIFVDGVKYFTVQVSATLEQASP